MLAEHPSFGCVTIKSVSKEAWKKAHSFASWLLCPGFVGLQMCAFVRQLTHFQQERFHLLTTRKAHTQFHLFAALQSQYGFVAGQACSAFVLVAYPR